jgi:hypothetical protein
MANRFAVASGNFNDTATWSTTAAGSPGASVPVAGDNAIANNRNVTITANATCDNVRNDNLSGATAGGSFTLSSGVTLAANVIQGSVSGSCVWFISTSPSTAAIVGSITGGAGTTTIAVTNNSTGTLTVTGNSTGRAFSNASTGTLNIVGNCSATGSGGSAPLVTNATGVINITGNCVGGSGGASHCVSNTGNGAVNITGGVTGGSVGSAFGVNNTSTGQVTIIGDVTATSVNAVVSTSATVRISGSFTYAIDGLVPVSAPRIILNATPTAAKTRYALNGSGTFVDMFTADNSLGQANPTDVRSGVSYASGTLTGTCVVPAAGSVALGVPVGNTTGTAILTQAAVQSALTAQGLTTARAGNLDNLDATVSSRLAPSGTLAVVTTLTNAPTVPTASAIASQVRSELSVELGRVDAAISTRATPANIPAADITAIKAKTDALNTTRLAQVSTTEIVGNLLAQANS